MKLAKNKFVRKIYKILNYIVKRKNMKNRNKTHFKVNLGDGVEMLSWFRLNHLTESEKDYLFKNANQCSNYTGSLPCFNTENVVKLSDFYKSGFKIYR